jgi:hypothetical protein
MSVNKLQINKVVKKNMFNRNCTLNTTHHAVLPNTCRLMCADADSNVCRWRWGYLIRTLPLLSRSLGKIRNWTLWNGPRSFTFRVLLFNIHVSVYPKCSLRRVMDKQVDGTLCDLLCNKWTVASLSRDNPFQPKRSRGDVIQPSDVTCMPSYVNTPEPLPKTLVPLDAVFAVSTVEMDH